MFKVIFVKIIKWLILFNSIFKNERGVSASYSATDNFLPPIPAADLLIFSRGSLIVHQKIRNENDKTTKTTKNAKKVYVNIE